MRNRFQALVVFLGVVMFSSCISRTRQLPQNQVLLKADAITKSALLNELQKTSRAIKTLSVSKSTLKASQTLSNESIKDFHDATGRIAVDRPGHLRLEIEKVYPLAVMVSDEKKYKVSVPLKSKFGEGDVAAPSRGAVFPYNLRPNHILDALFVDGEQFDGKPNIRPALTVVTESQPDGIHSYSVITFMRTEPELVAIEELWFDRTVGVEEVVRKKSYLPDGEVEADIRYSNYQMFGNIPFPMKIVIKRPIENYSLEMDIEKMELNKAIDANMFVLNRPDGVDEVDLNTGKDIKPK